MKTFASPRGVVAVVRAVRHLLLGVNRDPTRTARIVALMLAGVLASGCTSAAAVQRGAARLGSLRQQCRRGDSVSCLDYASAQNDCRSVCASHESEERFAGSAGGAILLEIFDSRCRICQRALAQASEPAAVGNDAVGGNAADAPPKGEI
jgi:hypothetical protein